MACFRNQVYLRTEKLVNCKFSYPPTSTPDYSRVETAPAPKKNAPGEHPGALKKRVPESRLFLSYLDRSAEALDPEDGAAGTDNAPQFPG